MNLVSLKIRNSSTPMGSQVYRNHSYYKHTTPSGSNTSICKSVVHPPTIYAIVLRLGFGVKDWNELFSVMSVTFLFLLPTLVGALTVYLSEPQKVEKLWYRITIPWIPIFMVLIKRIPRRSAAG